jgi:2-polyprenyl-3-methyl-5-hydroxy-6-metoxy-1,4-benzoquinol methylase
VRELYSDEYFAEYPGGEAYDVDDAQRRYEAALRVRLVRRFLGGGSLFEVGAAAGHFLALAREAGFQVSGIEPAPSVAASARTRQRVDVRTGFLEDAELSPGSFDAVCMWHVLEHLPEPRAALGRAREALRPGGFLFLEVPNVESYWARRSGRDWFHLDPAHHLAHYAPRSLGRLLKLTDLEPVLTETFPALGYLRPGRALRPGALAAQARELALLRTLPRHPHPDSHELLRAVARRLDQSGP